jgi:hypothetical protein
MKLLVLFIIIISHELLFAQTQTPGLLRFNGFDIANQVRIVWSLDGNTPCADVTLQHSTDSFNFLFIHIIAGVCGVSGFEENYEYLHLNPVPNGKNYYRLVLSPGRISHIINVPTGTANQNDFVIFPHPVVSRSILQLKERLQGQFLFKIVNTQGVKVYDEFVSNIDFIRIPFSELKNGSYYFILSNGVRVIKGRFVKIE